MSEIELVDLGFKRIDVTEEESGGNSFYYYVYELSSDNLSFALISNSQDDTINGKWWVEFLEVPERKYMDAKKLKEMIDLIIQREK